MEILKKREFVRPKMSEETLSKLGEVQSAIDQLQGSYSLDCIEPVGNFILLSTKWGSSLIHVPTGGKNSQLQFREARIEKVSAKVRIERPDLEVGSLAIINLPRFAADTQGVFEFRRQSGTEEIRYYIVSPEVVRGIVRDSISDSEGA